VVAAARLAAPVAAGAAAARAADLPDNATGPDATAPGTAGLDRASPAPERTPAPIPLPITPLAPTDAPAQVRSEPAPALWALPEAGLMPGPVGEPVPAGSRPRSGAGPAVVAQLVQAALALPARAQDAPGLQVTLSPAELGRVAIRFDPDAGQPTLVLTVERLETLDLMRRNLDLLTAALREAGQTGCQVLLSGGEDGRHPPAGGQATPTHPAAAPEAPASARPDRAAGRNPPSNPPIGLDLRL
jgi:hypothetical protein